MKVYRKLIRPVHCYPGQGYEPKTELVEKEEKWYPEEEREHLEEKYGYLNEGHFSDLIFEEKYEPYLLKEQEAVAPVPLSNRRYACGNCGNSLWVSGQRFCASCGKQVKWNE